MLSQGSGSGRAASCGILLCPVAGMQGAGADAVGLDVTQMALGLRSLIASGVAHRQASPLTPPLSHSLTSLSNYLNPCLPITFALPADLSNLFCIRLTPPSLSHSSSHSFRSPSLPASLSPSSPADAPPLSHFALCPPDPFESKPQAGCITDCYLMQHSIILLLQISKKYRKHEAAQYKFRLLHGPTKIGFDWKTEAIRYAPMQPTPTMRFALTHPSLPFCAAQVLEGLVTADVGSPDAWEWVRHVRHYWEPEAELLSVAFAQVSGICTGQLLPSVSRLQHISATLYLLTDCLQLGCGAGEAPGAQSGTVGSEVLHSCTSALCAGVP